METSSNLFLVRFGMRIVELPFRGLDATRLEAGGSAVQQLNPIGC
jgi:hypothetical protein